MNIDPNSTYFDPDSLHALVPQIPSINPDLTADDPLTDDPTASDPANAVSGKKKRTKKNVTKDENGQVQDNTVVNVTSPEQLLLDPTDYIPTTDFSADEY